jgi:hypothetical protein
MLVLFDSCQAGSFQFTSGIDVASEAARVVHNAMCQHRHFGKISRRSAAMHAQSYRLRQRWRGAFLPLWRRARRLDDLRHARRRQPSFRQNSVGRLSSPARQR